MHLNNYRNLLWKNSKHILKIHLFEKIIFGQKETL
jgi:hypothetical protein